MSTNQLLARGIVVALFILFSLPSRAEYLQYEDDPNSKYNADCRFSRGGRVLYQGPCFAENSYGIMYISDLKLMTSCPSKENCSTASKTIKVPGNFFYVDSPTKKYSNIVWNNGGALKGNSIGTFIRSNGCWIRQQSQSELCLNFR